jgi:hypothetical protein
MAYGPTILLADHIKAPATEPIFSVADLDAAVKALKDKGLNDVKGPFDTPHGRAYSFTDPSGNKYSILQNENPDSLDRAYQDKTNKDAIRFD